MVKNPKELQKSVDKTDAEHEGRGAEGEVRTGRCTPVAEWQVPVDAEMKRPQMVEKENLLRTRLWRMWRRSPLREARRGAA